MLSPQVRHLALGAPDLVAVQRLLEIEAAKIRLVVRKPKSRRELRCQGLDVDEALVARGMNGAVVEVRRLDSSTANTRGLGLHQ